MAIGNEKYRTDPQQLEREAEAERAHAALVAESMKNLAPACPECGHLGSLEEFDGEIRCIDCDEVVLGKSKLAGFGRR